MLKTENPKGFTGKSKAPPESPLMSLQWKGISLGVAELCCAGQTI